MAYKAPQIDIGAILDAGKVINSSLNSVRENELANYKLDKEQKRYDEERAWKLEDRERAAKERQAADVYYGELAKGVQTKGGIYGDALATEANKYALTPDEMLKATLYKNDVNAARAAGDNTLADKLAWQTKVSEDVSPFMQSGVGEESRVEMYDRINSMVGGQGLPIPKEAILSADQARLAEKTATENAAKALKESKAEILKNDQANAWKYISALGNTSTVIDENGNEVQVKGPSASVQNRNNTSFNNDVDKGITDILKTIEDKAKGTESTSKAVVSDQAINLYTTLIRDQGISPEVASKLVSSGVGSEEAGWKSLWLGDPKAKLTKDQLSTILPSAMSAMELKKDAVGSTTSTVKGNDKQEAATNLVAALSTQNKTQLGSILDEQAKLAKGEEGRRTDKVNAWLQDRGLIDVPKAAATAVDTSVGATGKPLEARINKSIKSIDGIPDSMVASEGVTNTAYKDGKGYSIAMGYNLAANKDSVDKDFKDANISPDKAFIAKTRPQDLVLADGEAQRLSQVAYYKYADNLDKKLGGTLDKLSPQMQATALQMHYRGDLYNDADYSKELRKYVAKDDFNGLVNYVSNNADKLPAPVVRRLENDLGAPVTSNLRGNMSNDDKAAYLTKALNKGVNPEKVDVKEESDVISDYSTKKEKQDKELSSSAYSRTFGPKTEAGKYAKVWEESDSKKGSTLSKNISNLASVMDKDGITTYEDVATLYKNMPKGPDRDAVGEVLNYKGMQNSQEWRNAKAKEQYLEAGLTALSAIPGGGKIAKEVIAQPLKNAIRDRAEAAVVKKVVETPLALPNFSTGNSAWVNKNAVVATDKLNGVNLSRALEKSSPDSALINSLNSANTVKKELATTVPSNVANLNYFRLTKELDKFKNETDASMLWKGAIEAQRNGQITKEHLIQIMRDINDKGLINTRKLMEDLPK